MKHYLKLKYLLVLPPLVLCGAAICLCHRQSPVRKEITAATENDRTAWLALQGWEAELLTSEAVTIPTDFSGTYADYAAMQEQQQLPLSLYKGERAVRYTYLLKNTEPVLYAELLTAEGLLIGVQYYSPEA
jgi:hypothetical protein